MKSHGNGGPASERTTGSRRGLLLPPLLALVLFLPAVGQPFVWDDFSFLVHNESIRSVRNVPRFFVDESTAATGDESPGIYRPLRNTVWAVGHALWGLRPAGYHLQSILLHALVSLLVAMLGGRLGAGRLGATIAGCAFAVHPLATEAVVWIKAVDDLLVAVFLVSGAVVAAAAGRDVALGRSPAPGLWVSLILLQIGALAAKESGVVFPVVALLTLWLARERSPGAAGGAPSTAAGPVAAPRPALLGYLAVAAALDAGYLAVRTTVLGETGQLREPLVAGAALFWTQMRAVAHGMRLVLWPHPLQADYDGFPISTGPDPAALAALVGVSLVVVAAGVALARRRTPVAAWAVAWWWVCILPVSNLVPTMQFLAERFLYVALVAPAVALGLVVSHSVRAGLVTRRTAALAAALLLAILAGVADARVDDWSSPARLFQASADTPPRGTRPLANLVRSLFVEGRYREAQERLRQLGEREPAHPVLLDLRDDLPALAAVESDLPAMLERLDREPDNLELRLRLAELALHARHLGTADALLRDLPDSLAWRRWAGLAVVAGHRGRHAEAEDLLRRAEGELARTGRPPEEIDRWRRWARRALRAADGREIPLDAGDSPNRRPVSP